MNLASFRIRQVTFEIRYDSAYLLWDVAGSIAREVSGIWPGLGVEEAKPNQQILVGPGVRIQSGFDRAYVIVSAPKSVTQHYEQISETYKLWTTLLDIRVLNRVGTRTIFVREYDSEDAANRAVFELGLVRVPEGPVFNHRSAPTSAGITLRWRDDSNATTFLSMHADKQTLNVEAHGEFADQSKAIEKNFLTIDVDRATREPIDLAKFNVQQWLEGVQHIQSRDIPKFLELK